MFLHCGRFRLSLAHPLIMGVVNVTPDSFFDGGALGSTQAAVAHARRLIEEGADIVDIGGESTRPGAQTVTLDAERARVLPVLEQLADCTVPVSVDTRKPELMRDAIAAGASLINDIYSLREPGALEIVAPSNVAVCVMHMQGMPVDMQAAPQYDDVVAEVRAFLDERVRTLVAAGIAVQRIVVDPGFGFGKTLAHNLALLRGLDRFQIAGAAVLAGVSRKSMLGSITGRPVAERLHASVAAALIAASKGARILRVHDVAATRDALAVFNAVNEKE